MSTTLNGGSTVDNIYAMDKKKRRSRESTSGFTSGAWYEREADLFGVELLISEFLFHQHRREFPTGLDGIKGLAELFETSLTATGIRYATLSTEPVAVVVSEAGCGARCCVISATGTSSESARLEAGSKP